MKILILLTFLCLGSAQAATVKLSWDALEPQEGWTVTGIRLYRVYGSKRAYAKIVNLKPDAVSFTDLTAAEASNVYFLRTVGIEKGIEIESEPSNAIAVTPK